MTPRRLLPCFPSHPAAPLSVADTHAMLWWRSSSTFRASLGANFGHAQRVHANAAAHYLLFCTPRYTTSLFGLRVKEHKKRQFVHILLPSATDFAHALQHAGKPLARAFEFAKLKAVKGNDVHRILLIRPLGQAFPNEHLAACLLRALAQAPSMDLNTWAQQVSSCQMGQALSDAQLPTAGCSSVNHSDACHSSTSLATTSSRSRSSALSCGLHSSCHAL